MSKPKTIILLCEQCGKERILQYRSNRKPSPLCRSCGNKGDKNGHWKGGITQTSERYNRQEVVIICKVCGTEFRTKKSYSRYCSDDCRKKAHRRLFLESNAFYKRTRRRREKEATGSYSKNDFNRIIRRIGSICPRCGIKLMPEEFTADHIIPYCHGGSNNILNIQPLCHLCNVQKNTRCDRYVPEEMYSELG